MLIIGTCTEVVNEDSLRLGGFDFEEIKETNIVSKYWFKLRGSKTVCDDPLKMHLKRLIFNLIEYLYNEYF